VEWHDQSPARDHDACGVGFIARLDGEPGREVLDHALVALRRLEHRGGMDADGTSSDGVGILAGMPEEFFRRVASKIDIRLPEQFAVAMAFLYGSSTNHVADLLARAAGEFSLRYLGERVVPTQASVLGDRSRSVAPEVRQYFLASEEGTGDFERYLFLLRKYVESVLKTQAYFASFSSRTVIYKGLLGPAQLTGFYPDLADPDFKTPFTIFHQRFSTNTRPTWNLAQPFRSLAHNGEINTISGNRRWMRAREAAIRQKIEAGDWFQALEREVSDSASLDNAHELGLRLGANCPASIMRLVPPAWENDVTLAPGLRSFLESAAETQEPWDGPAALMCTDGRYVCVSQS
jgi:glutamate synthase domain-containing protein 1